MLVYQSHDQASNPQYHILIFSRYWWIWI